MRIECELCEEWWSYSIYPPFARNDLERHLEEDHA
jgi:hypothetical protein